ncbi:hypothetical protein [Mesorhizobium sp. L2C067A000]|uniref:hypothetical protein n=1 Tax=Mesorhizobium sp. L2C067A000 TaxID=1287106 RepID=UPI0012DC5DD0|nr:hypothetical protein [Mesorhizobium sp. L2C067A000]
MIGAGNGPTEVMNLPVNALVGDQLGATFGAIYILGSDCSFFDLLDQKREIARSRRDSDTASGRPAAQQMPRVHEHPELLPQRFEVGPFLSGRNECSESSVKRRLAGSRTFIAARSLSPACRTSVIFGGPAKAWGDGTQH